MVIDRRQRGKIPLDRAREVVVIGGLVDDTQARSPAGAGSGAAGVTEFPDPRPFGGAEERYGREQQQDREQAHTPRILTT